MICILTAAGVISLAAESFTLSWQHSTARTLWTETWAVKEGTLHLELARVEGPGAGMEAPEGAIREGTTWVWHPQLPPLPEVFLAASGATGSGWQLCADGQCLEIGGSTGEAIRLSAIADPLPCPISSGQ